jgi:NAD(P)-dependent dehydrogenase (short-subunit alcohol dehydrogenase family)
MSYFVTGATGFLGRHLVERLVARGDTIHALIREGSEEKLEALRQRLGVGSNRLVGVTGDLSAPRLGVEAEELERLRGNVDHLFHLAAIYDMEADAEVQYRANVTGTERTLEFANTVEAGVVQHTSSIAAAGDYNGWFREDMLSEATGLDDPYFATKHQSEQAVHTGCDRPFRIYRPGIIVGHSETGEIDKVDGPYYLFRLLKKLRYALPGWAPLPGVEGRRVNLVPVDFVADAIDHIAHLDGRNGQTFHLVDPNPDTAGDIANTLAKAAGAPRFGMRLDPKVFEAVPSSVTGMVGALPPVKRTVDSVLGDLGIPKQILSYMNNPTRFDCRNAQDALEGSGIAVPPLERYADRLWDYWERHLDPDLYRDRTLAGRVEGKVVLVTGASSGIGNATARRIAEAGGHVCLVARSQEKLDSLRDEIVEVGGTAYSHPGDLSDEQSISKLIDGVLDEHGGVDILVNCAGMSIRRSVALSYERLHDYKRTMQLNYFGALQLVLGFLPGMRERGGGHIVNVSSMGVQTNVPRFSAYVASKSALDAFSRCIAAEVVDDGVDITTIYMPLVETPMIEPTKIYKAFPTISPEQAAGMVADGIIDRPKKIASGLGNFAEVAYAAAPKLVDSVLNMGYHLFPDSSAAKKSAGQGGDGQGGDDSEEQTSTEGMAFAYLLRGIHW